MFGLTSLVTAGTVLKTGGLHPSIKVTATRLMARQNYNEEFM